MLETCEYHSHRHRYPGTRRLNLPNYSLSYQLSLAESLCLLAPAFQHIGAAVLIQLLLLGESALYTMLQIHLSFNTSVSLP